MVKRVIQVPVDEELLKDLDSLSKKQRRTRAELIRQACLTYLLGNVQFFCCQEMPLIA